jgi:hypothetical protein
VPDCLLLDISFVDASGAGMLGVEVMGLDLGVTEDSERLRLGVGTSPRIVQVS